MDIQIKRIYESASSEDGLRILVDRLWPRGISKEKAALDHWVKDFAPSTDLRKWYHQHIDEWEEFVRLYKEELLLNEQKIQTFFNELKTVRLTMLYSSKLKDRNHAILLRQFLFDLYI